MNQNQQNAGVNFRRMSVEMTEQQQKNMINEPATNVMNSTLEGLRKRIILLMLMRGDDKKY